jgi:hypothetical protein
VNRRVWLCGILVAACGGPPLPAPVAAPLQDIVRRHYDQACQDGRAGLGVLQVSELFDTVGLGGELEAKGLRPPTRVREHAMLDFVTRYRADHARARRSHGLRQVERPIHAEGFAGCVRDRAHRQR